MLDRESFDCESLERPALVALPGGGWRLYVSCATPGTKHWRVDALDAVEDGRSFIEIVAAAQAKARPAVARLLVTIAAPTLGRSSGHKRTAMEGNR